jgi:hypothetical protein
VLKSGCIGSVSALDDLVVDVPSLVNNLVRNQTDNIVHGNHDSIQVDENGIALRIRGHPHPIHPRHLLLCAGAGNESLLEKLPFAAPSMQRRPLRQIIVRHPDLPELYGHELGNGSRPTITVSSHNAASGERVWYLGGELAERGASLDEANSLDLARNILQRSFPQLPLDKAHWSSVLIDRAESAQDRGKRPAGSYCEQLGILGQTRVFLAWPTKLSLVPQLAQQFESLLQPASAEPHPMPKSYQNQDQWQSATPPWEATP